MNFKRIIWGVLPAAIALSSCDKISQPLKSAVETSVLPTTPPTFKDSSAESGAYAYTNYKMLLEDLTGHFCVNCPVAAMIGDSLINPVKNPAYYGNIVYVQENIGFDAVPAPGIQPPAGLPSYAFKADYRCYAGNSWQTLLDPSNSYPFGVFNRRDYPNFDIPYPGWNSEISDTIFPTLPSVQSTINIHDSCWVPQRIIGATFKVNIVKALPGANYQLVALIVEDSIIDWQMDELVAAGYDSVFVHRNVLRGAFGNNTGGNPSGISIPASVTGTAGSSWTTFLTYDFNNGENGKAASWNMAHCYIVAFICNGSTNTTPYQVVQAEMIKIE